MAPAGMSIISYIKFVTMTISHHMPCKNKLDVSNLFLHILRGLGLSEIEPFKPTNMNHNVDKQIIINPL